MLPRDQYLNRSIRTDKVRMVLCSTVLRAFIQPLNVLLEVILPYHCQSLSVLPACSFNGSIEEFVVVFFFVLVNVLLQAVHFLSVLSLLAIARFDSSVSEILKGLHCMTSFAIF